MANANIWNTRLPKDDQQAQEYEILPAGTYDFEVGNIEAKAHEAKPGGKIGYCAELDLRLEVQHNNKTAYVFDRLYSDPLTAWRMKQFAACVGIDVTDELTPGDVYREAKARGGRFTVGVREYNGKKQNEVKAYLKPEPAKEPKAEVISNDDLPF